MVAKGPGQFWYTDDKGRRRQTQAGRLKKAKVHRDRRDTYLKGKVCALCGEVGSKVSWLPGLDPKPKISTSIIWTYGDERRVDYLQYTHVLCETHFNKSRGRTHEIEHGGGRRGKPGCDCEPCVAKRREHGAEESRKLRARRRVRKQLLKEKEQGK